MKNKIYQSTQYTPEKENKDRNYRMIEQVHETQNELSENIENTGVRCRRENSRLGINSANCIIGMITMILTVTFCSRTMLETPELVRTLQTIVIGEIVIFCIIPAVTLVSLVIGWVRGIKGEV